GRFPSVLRFRLYQILAVLIFAGAFRPFGFFAVPTLPDPFGVSAFRFRPLLERVLFRAFRRAHHFSGFPRRLIIESLFRISACRNSSR
ncbi:hypothetical protein, partial [Streptomyces monomycini]|uniref:hypothetical protein n=1 Tax=Streptomyces monomycini TaxID=371720 RepID=UPI001EEB6F01